MTNSTQPLVQGGGKKKRKGVNGTSEEEGEERQTTITTTTTTTTTTTDLERWRLLDERGRQTWHYLSTDEAVQAWPQTVVDRHHLGLPLVRKLECIENLFFFFFLGALMENSNKQYPIIKQTANEGYMLRYTGSTEPPPRANAFGFRHQRRHLFRSAAASTRQLGQRVWRADVPPAGPGGGVVCDQDAHIGTLCDGNETVFVRAAAPGGWGVGIAYRRGELRVWDGNELRRFADFGSG